jgi:hypothetical protein
MKLSVKNLKSGDKFTLQVTDTTTVTELYSMIQETSQILEYECKKFPD